MAANYKKIASFKDASEFLSFLKAEGIEIPSDTELKTGAGAPLAREASYHGRKIGNRLCVLPLEGWDCELDGRPSELMMRRWDRFGLSGAKLLWGCEAAAVRHDGRSNTRQLMIADSTAAGIEKARVSTSASSSRIRAASPSPTTTRSTSRASPTAIRSSTRSSISTTSIAR
jgi:hypothetical protein